MTVVKRTFGPLPHPKELAHAACWVNDSWCGADDCVMAERHRVELVELREVRIRPPQAR